MRSNKSNYRGGQGQTNYGEWVKDKLKIGE